jgi:hypothetical protein
MPSELASTIDGLVDAAEYALEVLEDYSDVDDGDEGLPIPNRAMLAKTELERALKIFRLRRIERDMASKNGVIL